MRTSEIDMVSLHALDMDVLMMLLTTYIETIFIKYYRSIVSLLERYGAYRNCTEIHNLSEKWRHLISSSS